jgi:hypothetical protein
MFRNQTPRLTTQPDMRTSLAVLETMFVDDTLNLFCSTAVGAQRCETLGPAVEKDGLVEFAEFGSDGGGCAGELVGNGVYVDGFDGDGQGEVGGDFVVGEFGLSEFVSLLMMS